MLHSTRTLSAIFVSFLTLASASSFAASDIAAPFVLRDLRSTRTVAPELTDEQCKAIFDTHTLDQQRSAAVGAALNEAGLGADFTSAAAVNLRPETARELANLIADEIRADLNAEAPTFFRKTRFAYMAVDAALAGALLHYARRVESGANPTQALTALVADPRLAAAARRYAELWLPIVERCGLFPDAATASRLATLTRTAAQASADTTPAVAQEANAAVRTFLTALADALNDYASAVAAGQGRIETAEVLLSSLAPTGAAADDLIRGLLERCKVNASLSTVTRAGAPLTDAECSDAYNWYRTTTVRFTDYNRALREANINLLQTGISLPGNLGAVDLDGGLLLNEGVYTPLRNVPGALATAHVRMNDRGWIVGTYVTPGDANQAVLHGFLMRDGAVTTIDVPGAESTVALGINDIGQVVGGYVEPGTVPDPTGETPTRGFLWHKGRFTFIDVPGATSTAPYEINNRGQIAGHFPAADGVQRGFILRDGVFSTIAHPNATQIPNVTSTRIVGIDDAGRIVGSFGDDAGILHAYMRNRSGEFTTIDPPGALAGAEASNINARGRIAGRFQDATPKLVSFLFDRGEFSTIDALGRCDTAAFDINARGQILITATGTADGSTCTRGAMPPAMTEMIRRMTGE